jgi:Domain of unknown function (DUF6249)
MHLTAKRIHMKALFFSHGCSVALALTAFAQQPSPSATASNAPSPPASLAPAATATASASDDLATRIQERIDKKLRKHVNATATDRQADGDDLAEIGDLGERMAVPIVAIVFLTLFGAPVLIVAVIMYFGFSKNRMMHRTIRMMVEKGQPVPPALLAPPSPAVRQRSDMRRGVVLVMIGLGLMLFLGAVNEWEGGAWAIGVIPFLVGLGYLLVWKLEGRRDIPPPLPPP